jgi:hypothetical protein
MAGLSHAKRSHRGQFTAVKPVRRRHRIIRVHCDSVCSIFIGPNPTATTSHPRLAASQTEYLEINAGDQLAVIANT